MRVPALRWQEGECGGIGRGDAHQLNSSADKRFVVGRIDRVKGSGRKKPNPPGRRRRGKKRSPALARQRPAVADGAGAEAAEWAAAEAAAEAMEEEEEEDEDEDEEEEEGAEADAEFEAEAAEVTVGGSEGAAKSDASPDGALRVTPPTDVQES